MKYILHLLVTIFLLYFQFANSENIKEVPKAIWEPIFFEEINQRESLIGLSPLREKSIAQNDIEIRIWEGFGVAYLRGFIFSFSNNEWKAVEMPSQKNPALRSLASPRSGWKKFIESLTKEGIYTLPDSSALKGEQSVLDGTSYVVELLSGNKYRVYAYMNPQHQPWPEAKAMLKIIGIIENEFNQTLKAQPSAAGDAASGAH